METVAAKSYVEFVKEASDTFFQLRGEPKPSPEEMVGIKNRFNAEEFKLRSSALEKELVVNCKKYKNSDAIIYYMAELFKDEFKYLVLLPEEVEEIMKDGFECEFMIQLANSLSDANFNFMFYGCKIADGVIDYSSYYDDLSAEHPEVDTRLDFNQLKTECSQLSSTIQKINLITNRLYDLKQWQLVHDELIYKDKKGSLATPRYKYSSFYYPNFEQLCAIELERLNKTLELEKQSALLPVDTTTNSVTHQAEGYSSPYRWAKKNVDLVELIVALSLSGAIERRDGRPTTRIELMRFFGEILNKPIKAPEQEIAKLIGRDNPAAFTESLTNAIYGYRVELLDK